MKKAIFALSCIFLVGSCMAVSPPGFDNHQGKNIFEDEKFNAPVEQTVEVTIIKNDVVEVFVLSARVDEVTGEIEFLKTEAIEKSTIEISAGSARSSKECEYECLLYKNILSLYNSTDLPGKIYPSEYSKSWYSMHMRSQG